MTAPIVVDGEAQDHRAGQTQFKWGSMFDVHFLDGATGRAARKPHDTEVRIGENLQTFQWPWIRDSKEEEGIVQNSPAAEAEYWWQRDLAVEDWKRETPTSVAEPEGPGIFISWSAFPYGNYLHVNGVLVLAPEKVLAGFVRKVPPPEPLPPGQEPVPSDVLSIIVVEGNNSATPRIVSLYEYLPVDEDDAEPWKKNWEYTLPNAAPEIFRLFTRKVAVNPDGTEARFVASYLTTIAESNSVECEKEFIVDIETGVFTTGYDSKTSFPVQTRVYTETNDDITALPSVGTWGIVKPWEYNGGFGVGGSAGVVQTYKITRRWHFSWQSAQQSEDFGWNPEGEGEDGSCYKFPSGEIRSVDGRLPKPGDILRFDNSIRYTGIPAFMITSTTSVYGEEADITGYFINDTNGYRDGKQVRVYSSNDSGVVKSSFVNTDTRNASGRRIVDVDYQLDGQVVKLFYDITHSYSETWDRVFIAESNGPGNGTVKNDYDENKSTTGYFTYEGGRYDGVQVPGHNHREWVDQWTGVFTTYKPVPYTYDGVPPLTHWAMNGHKYWDIPVEHTSSSQTRKIGPVSGTNPARSVYAPWYDLRFGLLLVEKDGIEETYTEYAMAYGPYTLAWKWRDSFQGCTWPAEYNWWESTGNVSRPSDWTLTSTEVWAFELYRGGLLQGSWGKGGTTTTEENFPNTPVTNFGSVRYLQEQPEWPLNAFVREASVNETTSSPYTDNSSPVTSNLARIKPLAATDVHGNVMCDPNEWYMSGGNFGYSSFSTSPERCRYIDKLDEEVGQEPKVTSHTDPGSAFDRGGRSIYPVKCTSVLKSLNSTRLYEEESDGVITSTQLLVEPAWKSRAIRYLEEYLPEIPFKHLLKSLM